ncbi:di-trans,poly-cis-decaprenylcistransferase [Zychaea mexicana]|uniref:di-trans,poly-cis-decaprenylcistransferase n=1 Tax=Zychaea mexicana TaxID=64656 RepID=UPI0022FE0CB2|nr:di-trans,poly-cis-decaprenylcistransferase [Zychaea mexicana]KAI9492535.1 di-trans,poly-cis-decaprenylcistransferase [Zychaea mexicana]
MISTIYDYGTAAAQKAAIAVLRRGRIPQHIGLILDGNRRYAKKAGASDTKSGHYEGCERLKKVVRFCMELGIHSITVFGFSIENFKRSEEEVAYLMQLFREIFATIPEDECFAYYKVGMRVCGRLSCLPPDVVELAHEVMDRTKHNTERYVNVCCAYTSRDEMATAIKENVHLVEEGEMDIDDITERSIQNHLFTSRSPPLDILVRTSGEIRLSDFLLWQASDHCQIQILNCLWPEITFWKILPILLEYQIYHDTSRNYNNNNKSVVSGSITTTSTAAAAAAADDDEGSRSSK